jgi:hypothetical protein
VLCGFSTRTASDDCCCWGWLIVQVVFDPSWNPAHDLQGEAHCSESSVAKQTVHVLAEEGLIVSVATQ